MKLLTILLACLLKGHLSYCEENVNILFDKINEDYVKFNAIAAQISWDSSIQPDKPDLIIRTANYQKTFIVWQQTTCEQLVALHERHLLNNTQISQTYLLCRGPRYTYSEAQALSSLYDKLQELYSNNHICLPVAHNVSKENLTQIEDAILNYMSAVNVLSKVNNGIEVPSKMAVKSNYNEGMCLNGEYEFGILMKHLKNEEVLKFLWTVWTEKIGKAMKEPYNRMVELQNSGAWRNGSPDIGASWRDDPEVYNLRDKCNQLYSKVKPLYTLLHGIVRFYLRRKYGDVVPKRGAIPAHLLGNLWTQNWEPLADLISPKTINLDDSIKDLNWTVHHMVKRVEDFYQSLGLPAMTDTFWRESVFEKKNGDTRCHGTAADMFKDGDFRILYCSHTSMEDFHILHHEFGHIQYFMAYENQPGIFRQANPVLQESIADSIMYGVMTPQHLHRLGLVNDSILYVNSTNDFNKRSQAEDYTDDDDRKDEMLETKNSVDFEPGMEFETNDDARLRKVDDEAIADKKLNKNLKTRDYRLIHEPSETNEGANSVRTTKNEFANDLEEENDLTSDEILLLKQALNKIPQIPFALLIDEFRWKYFGGPIDIDRLNEIFWLMSLRMQGISPPDERTEKYLDIGANFHVSDNTPYIRYFLSSFLQHQIFEALCRAAVFGRRDVSTDIPDTITMHRCDIYGSKSAGKLLKDLMSRGNSQHWQEILESTIGDYDITSSALERYYRPLYDVLARIVKKHNIPLGW